MAITMTLTGDGLRRMARAAKVIGARGEAAMARGLRDGGLRARTKIRRALVEQTGVKARMISQRTAGSLDPRAGGLAYVIEGRGPGVPIQSVRGLRARRYRPRDPSEHPRDALGRFVEWPNPQLDRGLVSASPWQTRRTFWRSIRSANGRYVQVQPDGSMHTLYGPSPSKELVQGQSLAAFHASAPLIEERIAVRIAKLGAGAVTRGR